MSIINTPGARRRAKALLLCVAAFALGVLGVSVISASRRAAPVQRKIGYDFSPSLNAEWSGPKIGERLDLRRFVGPDGKPIADSVDGDILMLATIDPDCGASWVARDELRDVSNHIAPAEVPYLLVSVTNSRPSGDFFKYAESVVKGAPAFLWASKEVSPPESLVMMVVPSHLLVKRDGTILRKWPGTRQSQRLRFRMVNQIVADTIEIANK